MMNDRQTVLSQYGYDVTYETRPKYRCAGGTTTLCIAKRDGIRYFAFTIDHPAYPEHFRRLESIQSSIPHMAHIVGPIENVVLIEEARGQLLWHLDARPDDISEIEEQLIEFAQGTKNEHLVHGDLRPWNVVLDDDGCVQVIDWWSLSAFVDDLVGGSPRRVDLIQNRKLEAPGHYVRFHADLVAEGRFTDIDLADATLIGKLLRGETCLRDSQAWCGYYSGFDPFLWQIPS